MAEPRDVDELSEHSIDDDDDGTVLIQAAPLTPYKDHGVVTLDDCYGDGFIMQLKEHINIWDEPCILRLSDILKKSKGFRTTKNLAEYRRYLTDAQKQQVSTTCMRYYSLPQSHTEHTSCSCIFCDACMESMDLIVSNGMEGEYLAECLMDRIRHRTLTVIVSQIQMVFKEEPADALDQRLCYGFKNALPPLVVMNFEKLFRLMYSMGTEIAYEILKHLSVFLKYNVTYNSALQFVKFWTDVIHRFLGVIGRLDDDLHCFDWKLRQYNISLQTFFLHHIEYLIYDLEEFQGILTQARRVISVQRLAHPRRKEMSNSVLVYAVDSVHEIMKETKKLWDERQLPFEFSEPFIPSVNMFQVSLVRNPFKPFLHNECEAYEVVEAPRGNLDLTFEYRGVSQEDLAELERAEPMMDVSISKHFCLTEKFNIRVYRRSVKITEREKEHFINKKDITYLNCHGVDVSVAPGGKEFIQNFYLKQRKESNLDAVEGPLPPGVLKILDQIAHRKLELHEYVYERKPRRPRRKRVLKKRPSFAVYKRSTREKFSVRTLTKYVKESLLQSPDCMQGENCIHYEGADSVSRHNYNYGGRPPIHDEVDPKVLLTHEAKWEFFQEILRPAMQMGHGAVRALDGKETNVYKYYILFSLVTGDGKERYAELSQEKKSEVMISDLATMAMTHYGMLAKFELITIDESLNSPHRYEKYWAETMNKELTKGELDKLPQCHRQDLVEWSSKRKQEKSKPNVQAGDTESSRRKSAPAGVGIVERMQQHTMSDCCKGVAQPSEIQQSTFEQDYDCPCPTCSYLEAHDCHSVCDHKAMQSSMGMFMGEQQRGPRTGIRLSAGYAEKRQDLRQKLETSKKATAESSKNQSNTGTGKKTSKHETVVYTVPPPTDDLDELVNFVEGSGPTATNVQSAKSSDANKNAAKKARRREKKEQAKLEEEAKKREEEERKQREEEERLKREEEALEEERRKKREKKKKNKKNKKQKQSNPDDKDVETVVVGPPSQPHPAAVQVSDGCSSSGGKQDLVTIRRFPKGPDTEVTISLTKSTDGGENILYTLVNGQVVSTEHESAQNTAEVKSENKETKTAPAKNKKKKKNKQQEDQAVVEKSTELANTSTPASVEYYRSDKERKTMSGSRPVNQNPELGKSHQTRHPIAYLNGPEGSEIDLTQLNLPDGITITKVNPGQTRRRSQRGGLDSDINQMSDAMSNKLSFNNESVYYFSDQETEEFEEVVSNKTKRLRSRARKTGNDGEDVESGELPKPEKGAHRSRFDSCSKAQVGFKESAVKVNRHQSPPSHANPIRALSPRTRRQLQLAQSSRAPQPPVPNVFGPRAPVQIPYNPHSVLQMGPNIFHGDGRHVRPMRAEIPRMSGNRGMVIQQNWSPPLTQPNSYTYQHSQQQQAMPPRGDEYQNPYAYRTMMPTAAGIWGHHGTLTGSTPHGTSGFMSGPTNPYTVRYPSAVPDSGVTIRPLQVDTPIETRWRERESPFQGISQLSPGIRGMNNNPHESSRLYELSQLSPSNVRGLNNNPHESSRLYELSQLSPSNVRGLNNNPHESSRLYELSQLSPSNVRGMNNNPRENSRLSDLSQLSPGNVRGTNNNPQENLRSFEFPLGLLDFQKNECNGDLDEVKPCVHGAIGDHRRGTQSPRNQTNVPANGEQVSNSGPNASRVNPDGSLADPNPDFPPFDLGRVLGSHMRPGSAEIPTPSPFGFPNQSGNQNNMLHRPAGVAPNLGSGFDQNPRLDQPNVSERLNRNIQQNMYPVQFGFSSNGATENNPLPPAQSRQFFGQYFDGRGNL